MSKCGLCKSAVYALAKDGKFPTSIPLAGTKAVGWSENAINEWIEQQIEAAKATPVQATWLTGSAAIEALKSGDFRG